MSFLLGCSSSQEKLLLIPVDQYDRHNSSLIQLTEIGDFGIQRVARPGIPAHLHTGIDIARPSNNYMHEPIFPIAKGRVISKRTDGPYAQLILEHQLPSDTFWTLYEHIAEILVSPGQEVNTSTELARFFNRQELDTHGWQFDHFHFEILRTAPLPIQPTEDTPDRYFLSRTLQCYTEAQLLTHFYDPVSFLKNPQK
ncbi:M23 family metallopeptidase [Marinoscillum sp.]|uniref:M23 family metallopeptidase n=1 Tax=Marinoscillum sp. TaxID=2024838 RepID=UPI003BABE0A7